MTAGELIEYLWRQPRDTEVKIALNEDWEAEAFDVLYQGKTVIIIGEDYGQE